MRLHLLAGSGDASDTAQGDGVIRGAIVCIAGLHGRRGDLNKDGQYAPNHVNLMIPGEIEYLLFSAG